jgi:hypothetical protein
MKTGYQSIQSALLQQDSFFDAKSQNFMIPFEKQNPLSHSEFDSQSSPGCFLHIPFLQHLSCPQIFPQVPQLNGSKSVYVQVPSGDNSLIQHVLFSKHSNDAQGSNGSIVVGGIVVDGGNVVGTLVKFK